MSSGDHLIPEVRSRLDDTLENRLLAVDTDVYIPHQRAERILEFMERLYARPASGRQGMLISGPSGSGKSTILKVFGKKHPRKRLGVLISGPSGSGKSTILKEFCVKHPRTSRRDFEEISVLRVETPEVPGSRRFLGAVLEALGYDDYESTSIESRRIRVTHVLKECLVKMILVDEIHNLLAGSPKAKEETCNLIKNLSNTFNIPFVLAGTERAANVFVYDPQLRSRFPVLTLPLWIDGRPLRDFLKALEATIPLKNPSNLYSDEKATYILKQSGGALSDIVQLVRSATRLALLDGSERVTLEHLKRSCGNAPQVLLNPVSASA